MELESFLRGSVSTAHGEGASSKESGNAPGAKDDDGTQEPEPEQGEEGDDSDPEDSADDDAKGEQEGGSPTATTASKDPAQGKEQAFLGERKRRQAAEKEAATLRATLESLRAQQQPQMQRDAAPPQQESFWDDPERAMQRQRDEVRRETTMLRYEMSEQMARSAHADFDEYRDEFLALAKANPVFVEQMRANGHPAEFAYQAGKRFRQARELGDVGDLDAWREQERQKLRDELTKELEGKRNLDAAAKVPESLADKRSAGAVKREPYRPATYEQIFDKSRFARK